MSDDEGSVDGAMEGLLRVMVNMNSERDKGNLTVGPDGTATAIQGDTSWLYVVE